MDDDVLARRYELLDRRLTTAGFRLVRGVQLEPAGRAVPAQPRLLEQRSVVGRRAGGTHHRFVGDTRWWNVKRSAYADALDENRLPGSGFQILDAARRHTEEVLLGHPVARRPAAGGARRRRTRPCPATRSSGVAARLGTDWVLTDGPAAGRRRGPRSAGRLETGGQPKASYRTPGIAGWSGSAAPHGPVQAVFEVRRCRAILTACGNRSP